MQSLVYGPFQRQQQVRSGLAEGSGRGKRVVISAPNRGHGGGLGTAEAGTAARSWRRAAALGAAIGRFGNGTRVEMTDGTTQTCTFEDGHYFNAGPARLPSQHVTMLGYCREFGVQLEVEVNSYAVRCCRTTNSTMAKRASTAGDQ